MAHVTMKFELSGRGAFDLSEVEMRALDALVGYGDTSFLKVFKEKVGWAYMRDHEAGLQSLFKSVREQVLPALRDIDRIREDITKAHLARAEAARALHQEPQP